MWYEIIHKQQKMPKARANNYVYNSTPFPGLIFEDEKTVPYDDDTMDCIVCDTNRIGLLVSCYGKAHPCQYGTEAYGERNPAMQ